MAQTDKKVRLFFSSAVIEFDTGIKGIQRRFPDIFGNQSEHSTSTFGVSHYTIINQGLERQERDKINLQKWLPANINLEQVSIQMYFFYCNELNKEVRAQLKAAKNGN